MPDDETQKPKIQIDDDWKEEAQREKEQLAEEAEQQQAAGPMPEVNFLELVNLLVMQAIAGLGGLQTPDGKAIPANFELAKHYIDLLGVIDEKTKGNLTEEEQGMLRNVLGELRMRYVQLAGSAAGAAASAPPATDVAPPADPPPAT